MWVYTNSDGAQPQAGLVLSGSALYGMTPGELHGPWASFDAHVHPDDLEALEAAIADCLETGEPYEAEFRVVRADRRRIDLLRVITPTAIEPPAADESTS